MTGSFDLHIETADGVRGLGRVVGVLALYHLTPVSLSLRGGGEDLSIDLQIEGELRSCELCIGRMRTVVSVRSAAMTPAASATAAA